MRIQCCPCPGEQPARGAPGAAQYRHHLHGAHCLGQRPLLLRLLGRGRVPLPPRGVARPHLPLLIQLHRALRLL